MYYRFSEKEVEKCKEFGRKIAWKHPHFKDDRNHEKRSTNQIISDVMRGKMAEIAVRNNILLELPDAIVTAIDFNVYPKGVADQGDIICNDFNISIKSSKPFASCLLIETQRFSLEEGVPVAIDGTPLPDYFVFVKVDHDTNVATICGMVSFEEFWKQKTFLPRGMTMNYYNAQRAMLEKCNPYQLPSDKGVPFLADNYGMHLKQLQHFTPTLFQRQPIHYEQCELELFL